MSQKNNQPYNGGGIVGAKPHYAGGHGRQPDVVSRRIDTAFEHALGGLKVHSGNAGGISTSFYIDASSFERAMSRIGRSLSARGEEFYQVARNEPVRVTAAQIHAELYAGVEADLLEPAPMTLAETPASERVSTLLALGFTEQPDVRRHREANADYARQNARYVTEITRFDLATRYALRYPAYKFITDKSLERVTDKYGLEVKETGQFIGTIPDANVLEMANFHRQVTIRPDDATLLTNQYLIAAPPDQFRQSFYGFSNVEAFRRWLIEDPIVLKSVVGGFLIVTAWGDEASDPDVLNERNN